MSTSDIIKKLEEIRALSRLIEEAEAELDGLKDEIKTYMGESESLTAGDWKVSYKTVTSSRADW
jgi:predicted phage-related endonuclease